MDELVTAPDSLLARSDLFAPVDQPGAGRFPFLRSLLALSPAGLTDLHTRHVVRSPDR